MNRIYKVIWSKVKHQYVVVSELAHSNGKQSRTSRNSIRSRIAALVVCGAIAAFGVYGAMPMQQAFAVTGGTATSGQYIAVAVDTNNNTYEKRQWVGGRWQTVTVNYEVGDTRQFEDASGTEYDYTYVRVQDEEGHYHNYWVRDGYTIEIDNEKRYPGAENNLIVKAYKDSEQTSTAGLLTSYQKASSAGNITTATGYNIQNSDTGMYGGAVNSGRPDTPTGFGYNLDLSGNGSYSTRVSLGEGNFSTYFKEVDLVNGIYRYNNQTVATNNLYVIGGKVGVFVNPTTNEVYTGNVYGDNNEILMSGMDNNQIYTYWGAKIDDPRATIENMTISQYNQDRQELKNDVKGVHGDDIEKITVGEDGTISLDRYGEYDAATDSYKGEHSVAGTIKVTSTGGTGGSGADNDVKIKFYNDENLDGFTVDAGSKVEAVQKEGSDKISAIKINGVDYALGTGGTIEGSFNPATGEISITQDGQSVLAGKIHDWKVVSGGFDSQTGKLTLNTKDTYGTDTGKVEIDGVASTTYVDNKDKLNVKYDSEAKNIVTLGGANGTTITNVANGVNPSDAVNFSQLKEVSDAEDYVTSGTLNTETGDITLTRKLGETVKIEGLQNYVKGLDTYVTDAKLDGNTLTINRNQGLDDLTIDLSSLTSGLSSTDYQVVANPAEGSNGVYSVDADGNLKLTVQDMNNPKAEPKEVSISGIAQKTYVDNKFGDFNYNNAEGDSDETSIVHNGDNVTEAISKLDNTVNAGWEAQVNGNKVKDITPTDRTLNFVGDGKYTTVSNDNGDIKISTDLSNLKAEDTNAVLYDGGDKTSVTLGGSTYDAEEKQGGTKITNLARGENPSDAVNFSQLKEVSDAEDYVTSGTLDTETGDITLTRKLGETVKIEGLQNYVKGLDTYVTDAKLDGNTLTINRNQGLDDLTIDLSSLTSGLSSTDYQVVANPAEGSNGVYSVDADGNLKLTVQDMNNPKAEPKEVSISGIAQKTYVDNKFGDFNYNNAEGDSDETSIVHNGDNVTEAISKLDNTVNAGWEAQVNGNKVKDITPTDRTLNFVGDGKYTTVSNDNGDIKISTDLSNLKAEDTNAVLYDGGDKTSVTLGGSTYDAEEKQGGTKITNLARGENPSDAVNFSQLKEVSDAEDYVTSGTLDTETGDITLTRKLGETVKIEGLQNYVKGLDTYVTDAKLDGNTLTINRNQGLDDLTIDLSSLTSGLSSTDYQVVANPAEGSNGVYSVDADGNLKLTVQDMNNPKAEPKEVSISGIAQKTYVDNKFGDFNYNNAEGDSDETSIVHNGDNVTVAVSKLDNSVTNLTNTVNDGWNAQAGDDSINVTPKDGKNTLNFAGDNNITVSADKDTSTIQVELNDDVYLGGNNTAKDNNIALEGSKGYISAENSHVEHTGTLFDPKPVTITNNFNFNEDGGSFASKEVMDNTRSSIFGTFGQKTENNTTANFDQNGATFSKKDVTTEYKGFLGKEETTVEDSYTNINGGTVTIHSEGRPAETGEANKDIVIDGTAGVMTGLSNTTTKYEGFASGVGRAATEEQLEEVQTGLIAADKYITGGTIDTSSGKINLTGTNGLTAEVSGLTDYQVTQEGSSFADNKLTLNLKDTLNTSNPDQTVVFDGIASTQDVEDAQKAATTVVKPGSNIEITEPEEATEDGHKEYTVSLADNVYLGGDNTAENNNISLDGENGVIGVGSTIALDGRDGTAVIGGVNINTTYDETTGKPSSTISGLSNTTTDYEGFATAGRAATEEQLQSAVNQSGWTASTNKNVEGLADETKITNGDTVDFSNTDGNIKVSQQEVKDDDGNIIGTDIKFDLSPDLTLAAETSKDNSIKLSGTGGYAQIVQGDTYTDIQGGTITVGSDIRGTDTIKINGTAGDITGLSNTTLDDLTFAKVGRAATEEQLSLVKSEAEKHTTLTVNGDVVAPADGTYTDGNLQLKQTVTDGQLQYDVKLNDNISLGNDKITLNGAPEEGEDLLNVDNALVVGQDGTTTVKNDNTTMTVGDSNVTIAVNDGTALGGANNTTVTVGTNGVTITGVTDEDGKGTTIIDGQKITAGGIVLNGELSQDGVYRGTITGLTNIDLDDPTFATVGRAATEEQLSLVKSEAEKHTTLTVNGDVVAPADGTYTDGNLQLKQTVTDGQLQYDVKLNDNISLGNDKITLNGAPEEGEDLLNVDNALVVGQDGTTTVKNDNTTMTVGDSNVTIAVNDGTALGGANNTTVTVGTNGVTITGVTDEDGKGTTNIDGQKITAGGIVLNGELSKDGVYRGTITGLTNTTTDYDGFATAGRAATEEQLKEASAAATTTVSEGKNINVTPTIDEEDGHTNYVVSLSDEVKLGDYDNGTGIYLSGASGTINATNSITVGEDQGIVIDGNKKTVNGLSNTTWNEDYQITSGQAATEDQLGAVANWTKEQITNSGWTVSTNGGTEDVKETDIKNGDTVDFSNTDGNIKVSQEVTEDGAKLSFDLNDRINIGQEIKLDGTTGNATFGNIMIGGSNGSSTITGLTNIKWDPNNIVSGQAATEDQLQQAISDAQTEFQQNDQHLVKNPYSADGHYFVDGKNQINMQVQNGYDENGNPKYDTVTIDNVAQASDVGDVGKLEDAGLGVDKDTGESNVVDAILDVNDKVDDLGGRVDDIETTAGQHSSVSNTDNNLKIDTGKNENGGIDYKVDLNSEKITLGDDNNNVIIEGTKGNISATGTISAGNASMSSNGFAIGDKTYITSNGINANGQKITNVADGTEATDAVNLGQLAQVANDSYTAINNVGNQVNRLSNRIDKVGAGAAALAALHPLDFDPDDKLSFAAGYGNYAGENAVAVGAFYQPNEDTMFSIGGTFGNDENMVNAGVSFKLGQKNNVSRSRVSMAKELVALRDEVAQLKALMAHSGVLPADGQIDTSALFPDVPENHWAYEYVHELAKLGIVEGYPDGNFDGDRMMTRYEFAAIVYRAMQKGVNVDRRMLTEFEPELKLIRVDVVAKDRNGNPTIERVRVNDDATQQA